MQGCAAHSRVQFARPASTDAAFARSMKQEVCLPALISMTRRMLQLLHLQLDITVFAGCVQCCSEGVVRCDHKVMIRFASIAQGDEKTCAAAMQAAHNVLAPPRPRPAPTLFNAASHQAC